MANSFQIGIDHIDKALAQVALSVMQTLSVVVHQLGVQVCQNCGEVYLDEATTARLLAVVDEAARAGVQVQVRDYIAA